MAALVRRVARADADERADAALERLELADDLDLGPPVEPGAQQRPLAHARGEVVVAVDHRPRAVGPRAEGPADRGRVGTREPPRDALGAPGGVAFPAEGVEGPPGPAAPGGAGERDGQRPREARVTYPVG